MAEAYRLSKDFIWRRLHSITGLFFTLYLIEHLLVNSRAAFMWSENGSGFIEAVNAIHDLPYLFFIEIILLGVPILIHLYWGVIYINTSRPNYYNNDPSKPILNNNSLNRAYTWQRLTAWILLVGVIAHVVHMRILDYPVSAQIGDTKNYMVRVSRDPGLDTLSARLGFQLYDAQAIAQKKAQISKPSTSKESALPGLVQQQQEQQRQWLKGLESFPLSEGEVMAVTPSFGMAELLLVRDTFKMPLMIALYTIFVLTACYHGFNGLWTFMIKWGITLTEKSQAAMRKVSIALMILVAFWGLSAIWITYWINLKN